MSAKRRGRQELNRKHFTPSGDSTGKAEQRSQLQLEMENNSWLRIGLAAKKKDTKFRFLFRHFTVANLRDAFRALDGSKAAGISGMTKRDYARCLDENLANLVDRVHKGTYRPMPKKGTFIPKANGKKRPIAISEFEDKLVEWLLAKALTAVYEPLFIRNSFGFRPRRSAHDAIKVAYQCLKDNKRPFVVEMDLANFFDTLPHQTLMKLLKRRVTDQRFLGLIGRFLHAGVVNQEGDLEISDAGTPQGSIMSPVLANVFLHYVLDEWVLEDYPSHKGVIIRYADDAIFIFEEEQKARGFQVALKERLEAFGLKLNEDKSGLTHFEKKSGAVFHFLGFTFYWGKDRGSTKRMLKVKTQRDKLFKKIQDFTDWMKVNRSCMKLNQIWEKTAAKLRGHYEYYGVHTNRNSLNHYYFAVTQSLFKWLNRRSQRKSFSWERFERRLRFNPLPQPPQVTRLYPLTNRWRYSHA